jgi:hypothetical protein
MLGDAMMGNCMGTLTGSCAQSAAEHQAMAAQQFMYLMRDAYISSIRPEPKKWKNHPLDKKFHERWLRNRGRRKMRIK